jgi:hypothetical protein
MVISKKDIQQTCRIEVEETKLTQVKSFKYLRATINKDSKNNTEVKSRVVQAKAAFRKMKKDCMQKSVIIGDQKASITDIHQTNSSIW